METSTVPAHDVQREIIRCYKCRIIIDTIKYKYHEEIDNFGVRNYWCLFPCWYGPEMHMSD